jgi:hypothetical protein
MQTRASSSLSFGKVLLFLALLLGAFAALLSIYAASSAPSMEGLILSDHADKHPEADNIRKCKNIIEIWLNSSCERLNVIKEMDNGDIADHVVQPCKRGLLEVTAYIIATGGDIKGARAILKAKGCFPVWP